MRNGVYLSHQMHPNTELCSPTSPDPTGLGVRESGLVLPALAREGGAGRGRAPWRPLTLLPLPVLEGT